MTYAPIRVGVDPRENYEFLGPLSPTEIYILSRSATDAHRKRYLSTIYGRATLNYAFQRYKAAESQLRQNRAVNVLQRSASAEAVQLSGGDDR